MLNIKYRELQYFMSVYEIGFFKHAATANNVTPPSVTEAIKNIETQLEGRVFIRPPKGVNSQIIPTDLGRKLYKQSLIIKQEFEKLNTLKNEQ